MPRKNHLMLVILLALLLTLVIIVFAPFAVSNGVRFWIWWRARQEGFVVSVDGIDAPFLSPLVIHEIHLKSTRDNALRIEVTATDAKVALNLKHLTYGTVEFNMTQSVRLRKDMSFGVVLSACLSA